MKIKKLLSIALIISVTASFSACNSSLENTQKESVSEIYDEISKVVNAATSGTSEKPFAFENNGVTYYYNGTEVLHLVDENTVNSFKVTDKEGIYDAINIKGSDKTLCVNGNNIYYIDYDGSINTYDVTDLSNITYSTIISYDKWLNSYNGYITPDNLQFYDDRIYFFFSPNSQVIASNTNGNLWYKLGSFKTDGSDFKFYDDITCIDYCIKDGWIFYYDEGFYYDATKPFQENFKRANAGLYKVKIDGTESRLITKDFQHSNPANYSCHDLKIYGNYLYFIVSTYDITDKLCRISLDGSGSIQQVYSKYHEKVLIVIRF